MNVVDFGMTMDEAIEQPRIFSYSSGGTRGPLRIEDTMDPLTVTLLRWRGHNTEVRERGGYFGTAQGILFDVDSGIMYGGADSRRLGVPVGY
jgi:gamma-glutamyltranspeptidase/glutathione hydrolase